jgi:predicted transcriptional regulator
VTQVLLSIKPEYAEKILDGTKKYEFRRSVFKNPDIRTIVIYASSPVQKVVGEFEIDTILTIELETLWNKTKKFAGISKEYFMEYFESKEKGYAIKIKSTKKYEDWLSIGEKFNAKPPQSFLYLTEENAPPQQNENKPARSHNKRQ